MSKPRVELIFFEGCPNTSVARDNLRVALVSAGCEPTWTAWNLYAESTPERLRRYGSPTVLVDGRDVTGEDAGGSAIACRADGAPSVESILEKLGRREGA